jgi:hypothetical protein
MMFLKSFVAIGALISSGELAWAPLPLTKPNPSQSAFAWERLDKNNSALLIVDHQVGLFQLVGDYTPAEYKNNV